MLTVRPKVAELAFQLYGRSLHPELFEIHKTHKIQRGNYEVKVDVTSAGHVATWRHQGMTLTEVAASAQHPLPKRRRLKSYRLKGQCSDRVQCRAGIVYHLNFQLETVPPEIFWNFQNELTADGENEGLLHRFDASGRVAMGAISYIHIETRSRSLLVQAFHTFPDDFAIVKSQTMFELPTAARTSC